MLSLLLNQLHMRVTDLQSRWSLDRRHSAKQSIVHRIQSHRHYCRYAYVWVFPFPLPEIDVINQYHLPSRLWRCLCRTSWWLYWTMLSISYESLHRHGDHPMHVDTRNQWIPLYRWYHLHYYPKLLQLRWFRRLWKKLQELRQGVWIRVCRYYWNRPNQIAWRYVSPILPNVCEDWDFVPFFWATKSTTRSYPKNANRLCPSPSYHPLHL